MSTRSRIPDNRFRPSARAREAAVSWDTRPAPGPELRLRFAARPDELAGMRRAFSTWLSTHVAEPPETGTILVAVSEAVTNAVEHAYEGAAGHVELIARKTSGRLTITVRDHGSWHRPRRSVGGGRGLGLIARIMDEFEIRRASDGTELTMRVAVGRGQ
jgi:anti-sigma regulatory factor (Ser/Thr protein kinase)